MWFRRQPKVDQNVALVNVLKEEIQVLRLQHDTDLQRMDRLMEALARRANVDLVMPMPPAPVVERTPLPNPWKDPSPVTDKFPGIDNRQLSQKTKEKMQ